MPDSAEVDELIAEAVRSHLLGDDEASRQAYARFVSVADVLRGVRPRATAAARQILGASDPALRAAAADLIGRLAFEASQGHGCRSVASRN
jgi:hypothetical protein